jgi:hypothetical protein
MNSLLRKNIYRNRVYRSNYPVAFFAYMIETISYGNINGEIEEADTEGSR